MPETWLITGAQGFIGRYLAAAVLGSKSDDTVIGLGRSPYLPDSFSHRVSGPDGPVPAPLPLAIEIACRTSRYTYVQTDLLESCCLSSVLKEFRPSKIVHLASGLRDDSRKKLFDTNVVGTGNLLDTIGLLTNYSPIVVLGSSGGVYGPSGTGHAPLVENMPCAPADEYSLSKLTSELLASLLARRYGLPLRIARIFNVVGPGQDERHAAGHIAAELQRFKRKQQVAVSLGPLHSTRDFIDVRDVALGLIALSGQDTGIEIYNIGSGREISIECLLQRFVEKTGLQPEMRQAGARFANIPRHFASTAKLAGLGVQPAFSLDDSVCSIWTYYERFWNTSL